MFQAWLLVCRSPKGTRAGVPALPCLVALFFSEVVVFCLLVHPAFIDFVVCQLDSRDDDYHGHNADSVVYLVMYLYDSSLLVQQYSINSIISMFVSIVSYYCLFTWKCVP